MSTTLTSFLIELGENPSQARAFRQDPYGFMAARGFSHEEQEALASGNSLRIGYAASDEPELLPLMVQLVSVTELSA